MPNNNVPVEFLIKRGLSTNLYDENQNLLIAPVEGCWYITTDTAELYVCNDGLTLDKVNVSDTFEPNVTANTKKNFPTIGKENVFYTAVDENAIYRWDGSDYTCVGRDYNDINVINGGNATS